MPNKEYLTQEDTARIEAQATCLRDKLLIHLLRRLGCRVTEILRLEEKHIDFENHFVRIEHQKQVFRLSCQNCGGKLAKKDKFCPTCARPVAKRIIQESNKRHLRKIPIDSDTLSLIRQYIRQGGINKVNGHHFLFKCSRQQAWKIVVSCAEHAGIYQLENPENEQMHHVSPHKFRDAWVINAMQKRPTFDDARLIQEMVGHQNIQTTLKYRKVALDELQKFTEDLIEGEK